MEAARKINQDTTLERVEVGGHTCDLGPAPYNKTLSERRASAVADFLVKQGNVPPAKLTVRGYGMEKPKVPNNSNENRERNRRVELTVLKRSQ
jgi:OOP family OmpA-OmpF porin